MKTLICFLIGFLAFSQPIKIDTIGLSPEIKEAVSEVAKEKQKSEILDQKLKQAETKTEQLKKKIESLVFKAIQKGKYKTDSSNILIKYANDKAALKPNTKLIYWEEIPRKWIGRLLNKYDFKIRIYEYQNGEKVYLD
ncbi:hypothetical protein [Chryseobacterium daeguense]|uniref:hypothetical protein n=1 Tax=Chryseobacterium daeguense TaxID=412438 RepID=UPI0003F92448|nr:hypothetical protein [Chryseobacterium daeguense]